MNLGTKDLPVNMHVSRWRAARPSLVTVGVRR